MKLNDAENFHKLIKGITIGILSLMVAAAAFLVYIRNCAWEPRQAAEYVTQNAAHLQSLGGYAKSLVNL